MSFHALAYQVAVGQTANTDMTALVDDVVTRQNNHYFSNVDLTLHWATAMSATINRARVVSPTLRQVTPPFIRPLMAGAQPTNFAEVADYRQYPFRLPRLEEIAVEITSDLAMSTEQSYAVLGVSAGMQPTPAGNIFTIRGTSTTASVANTWTTVTTTWADTLPDGRYAVVGLVGVAATHVAQRLIFEEQIWRPGSLGVTAVANQADKLFRLGGMGIWGTFNSWAFPQVQVLNTGAVSTHTFFMDIMRIS